MKEVILLKFNIRFMLISRHATPRNEWIKQSFYEISVCRALCADDPNINEKVSRFMNQLLRIS
jgi:hypothetical protein